MSGGTRAFAEPLLRDAVASALAAAAPGPASDFAAVAAAHWQLAAEMGWTATMVAEADGGLGLDLAHAADLCEAAGRHLFCGPLAETAMLLPAIARESGALSDLLPGIASGDVRAAYAEAALEAGPAALSMLPVEHAATDLAGGTTHVVHLSARAGEMQVTVVAAADAEFVALQPMDPTAPVARVTIADPSRCTRLALDAAAAARIRAALHVAVAADLLGVGEAALARTVEHVGSRRQFGQPIGGFQVVKHRLADVHTALGAARLAIACAVRPQATVDDARIARVLAADAARGATAAAIQLHGGSGFSWELDLHLYLKRARRLEARNGGTMRLRAAAGDAFIDRVAAGAS